MNRYWQDAEEDEFMMVRTGLARIILVVMACAAIGLETAADVSARGLKPKRGPSVSADYTLKVLDDAEKGKPNSITLLADRYYDGRLPQDDAKALELYLQGADAGAKGRLERIGDMYAEGRGAPADRAKAQHYWEMAVSYYAEKGEDKNYLAALAKMYALGKGVPKDPQRALQLYAQAATLGNARAGWIAGDYYYSGKEVPQDHAQALALYVRAAELGDTRRVDRVAEIQARGLGTPADQARAAQLVQRALEQSPSAAGEAGDAAAVLYKIGTVELEKGSADGLRKLYEAAAAGSLDAANSLGDAYRTGTGVEIDHAKALQWYLFAATRGSQSRLEAIGDIYAKGRAGPADEGAARSYWHRALQLHYANAYAQPNAAFSLGRFYRDGKGIPRDLAEARQWFTLAAQSGHERAADALVSLGEN
jgi:TPR repeat protein